MNLGGERKKVAILAVLGVIVVGRLYMVLAGNSSPAPAAPPIAASAAPSAEASAASTVSTLTNSATKSTARTQRRSDRSVNSEFRLRVVGSRPDDKKDLASIDPELRLDLLAKVQAVDPIQAGRNLFQFGSAPAPDKPIPAVPKGVPQIPITHPQPPPVSVATNTPTGPPPAPPINLKYYGYVISKVNGRKQACLLDGEDIMVVTENETVKQRYRIVRIALTSIDIEDIQAKSTQTLKLQDIPS